MTDATWLAYAGSFLFAARAMGLDLPWTFLLSLVFVTLLASVLPVTMAGIGTRDVLLVFLLGRLGYSRETALVFSAFFLLVYVEMLLACAAFFLVPAGKGVNADAERPALSSDPHI